jgi:PTH1 family peptidyl-tRNA hydrolase
VEPLVVAGLGNPGPRYGATRHNVGFAVAHRLADRLGARPLERAEAYAAWRAPGRGAEGRDLAIVTPLRFMNRSGEALAAFGAVHGLDPGRLLVVVDDVYLPLGRIRLRARGSTGGHNGLASIAGVLGTDLWARLRIGVGHAGSAADLADHVLAEFDEEERPELEGALERSTEAALVWAAEGITAAMNRFNAPAQGAGDNAPEGER